MLGGLKYFDPLTEIIYHEVSYNSGRPICDV